MKRGQILGCWSRAAARLTLETLDHLRGMSVSEVRNLEGNGAVQLGVMGQGDRPHASSAQLPEETIEVRVLAEQGHFATLRALGSATKPAAEVLARRLREGDAASRVAAAEALMAVDPSRSPQAVSALLEVLDARLRDPSPSAIPRMPWEPAYLALGRLDRSTRPAAKVLAEALTRRSDDELTAVLARALRRTDPAAAKAAAVR